jgi:hypothetical protein
MRFSSTRRRPRRRNCRRYGQKEETSVPDQRAICFRNSTDEAVTALHVIVAGTVNWNGREVTVGPPGDITIAENTLTVHLAAQLAPGMPLCFTVDGAEPLAIRSAWWSANDTIVGTAERES